MLKLLRQIDILDGEQQFNCEQGQVQGLLFVFEGTNASGVTSTNADLGRIIVERGGVQTHNRLFQRFAEIGDIRSGTNLNSSTEASDAVFSCFVPFFEVGMIQALNIQTAQELNIRFQPDNDAATNFDEGTMKVYAKIAPGLREQYTYFMTGNDNTYGGAVTSPEELNRQNVTMLYVNDPDTVIDRLEVTSDDRTIVSNIDFTSLQADTIYNNRIEDASFSTVQIPVYTPGIKGTAVNRNNILTPTVTGAGSVITTVCSVKFTSN